MVGAENGGFACKCMRESILHSRFSLEKRKSRKNLRSFSIIPLLRRELSRRRSVAVGGRNRILSMDAREKSRSPLSISSKQKRVPIFVMMPIDSIGIDTSGALKIRKIKALTISLKALKSAGVHGIAVEVWWGIVERSSPYAYNWSLYEELFRLISESGLKLHVALSFHSNTHLTSGGQGGVSLPLWILEIGRHNKDIYYQDRNGVTNDDYLTLGVDQHPLFCGRTALQCYEDFMFSFVNKFGALMGTLIEEMSVGLGPCGELRYPAHPFGDGRWRFPGIGEFQCYDKYMMEDLKMAAYQEGKPQWGNKGPYNAGCYNSFPSGVPFFEEGEDSFLSDFGHFFLEWYSSKLIHHADVILAKAANILEKYQANEQNNILLVAKIGIIYWWYHTVSHPAELTAGYYNTAVRDGYDPLASMLSRHRAALQISCFEMMDNEAPETYCCSPERLLQQIRTVSNKRIIHLTGRNSYERFDKAGLQQIHTNCYSPQAEAVRSFTYFRLNEKVFRVENWNNFVPFVRKMSTDL
ncbi:inactive beta-amylase 4, chloroplastic isoform X1 [Actinidia eriantha]|uniref:inactive beta-amylase 4, chloroplastic isoform X1 n=1 Tax=Actinidia eriantha TaxID=165200 RepID=UPI0025911142|nr:inactive beta-amylase 4, chloroplastic isoform X1 [Actinidia eriantha]